MAAHKPQEKEQMEKDPFAHERGLNPKLPHNEDPISEYRNEGRGDHGWHQGGDWGGGLASNVGVSAGETNEEPTSSDTPGSQEPDQNQAPGSNSQSTSTDAAHSESERQTKR